MDMFLLEFEHAGDKYLLHDGESFVGGTTEEEARVASINNTGKALSVGGFEIRRMTVQELLHAIDGVPYKIIDFRGGLGVPGFMGVKIVQVQHSL